MSFIKDSFLYRLLLKTTNRVVQGMANRRDAGPNSKTLLLAETPSFSPVLPVNAHQLSNQLVAYYHEKITLPSIFLHHLKQVAVSWHMVVFHNLRIFLPALAHPREEKHYNDAYLLQEWTGKRVAAPTDKRELALVHNQWTGSNYYHWVVDSLPRLLLLRISHDNARLLMPAPVPSFVQDSAAMLGFTDLLLLQPGEVLTGATLLLPDHVAPLGYQHPALLRQVRQELIEAVYQGEDLPIPHRRIYASRRSQRVRRLLNESEIIDSLVHHGYEVIEFEGLSLAEQVRLMAETRSFVTLHGAGLTNMLFLPSGAQVAELFNADKILELGNKDFENLIYFRMAAALGLSYYCLPCANVEDEPPTNEAHLRVNTDAFKNLLDLMSLHQNT